MTEYYNINFNNDETDKLDKLAREINNKKTSLCKKVTEDFNKQEKQWKDGIDNVINSQKFSYLPINKNFNKNINDNFLNDKNSSYSLGTLSDSDNTNYSEYSDLNSSKLSFDTNKTNNTNNTNNTSKSNSSNFLDFQTKDNKFFANKKNKSNFSDISSIDSFGSISSMDSFIDSESIDTYLKNPNAKKNVKFNKIVESIDYDDCSKNDDNILDHMKKCNNCKQKLLRFINGIGECSINDINGINGINGINNQNNINNNNNINNVNNDDLNKSKSLFGNIKSSSMNSKEIVIMLMIGVFIIIMLDLLLRNKN
jgi:hypothetical protein